MRKHDVLIIGAGLNGLVAGAWLAGQKRSVLILDRRPVAGGAAVTTEFVAGFRAPTLSHSLGPISAEVVRALGLGQAGIEFITPEPALTSIGRNDEAISFFQDPARTAASIRVVSEHDAAQWPLFLDSMQRIGKVGAWLNQRAAPSVDEVTARDWWHLLEFGRRSRTLGRRDLARAARWMPMAVADLAAEWFEHDLTTAAVAAHAIFGNPVGPWSAGTGGMLLQRVAADPLPVGSGVTVKGGPGALGLALARLATRAGASVRTDAPVSSLVIEKNRCAGVVLDDGEVIAARSVLAAVDPKQVFLDLVPADAVPPSFRARMSHYRARGVTAKVNLALSDTPVFPALGADLSEVGRLLVAPDLDYLERAHDAAKYGRCSPSPWLDLTIPTCRDSSLAPAGAHVMSVCVHFAPYHLRDATWPDTAEMLYRSTIQVLASVCPDIERLVAGREIVTPLDLEQRWGLSGGHVFHGETTLDQAWLARPLLGWAQCRSPIDGLLLGSAGTHPGGGLTGASGLLAAKEAHRQLK